MELLSQIFIVLAYIAAIGFFVFGLEDFIFDWQFVRHLWRSQNDKPVTLGQLRRKKEKYIAVMVPAWMEGGVVNRMADFAVKVLEYERYDIFIGVYPNDPETVSCVDAIERTCPRIHKVMCPNPGPTSKADCLNAIYRAMKLREIPEVREYEILCLHDSEDILHPLTLKIYNYFVPDRVEMGQIPVFPLELPPWRNWISNTYMDDFSELHLKDMLVRQEIGGVVPSAGVGTAFSRRAIDYLADHNEGDPFLVGNLTEDYFIGIQLRRAGFPAGFINYPIDRFRQKKNRHGEIKGKEIVTEIVAVRENFPGRFWDAVRQRSRWILGISMQCWELAGWSGSAPERYTLFRDRKAPLVHVINAIGYVVILSWLFHAIFGWLQLGATSYWRPLFTPDSFLWGLILVDTAFLFYRLLIKSYYVSQIYGWQQALFAIPRYPLGNVINFFATCRAVTMYIENRFFGRQLVWLKTTHVFPTVTDLRQFAASIEDLLVRDGVVPEEAVSRLLEEEHGQSVPATLLGMQLMEEEQYTALWARYSQLPERTISIRTIDPATTARLPEAQSIALGALPVGPDAAGTTVVVCLEPPADETVTTLTSILETPVETFLITPTNMRIIRDYAYSVQAMPRFRPSWAERFGVAADPEMVRRAEDIQHRSGRRFSDLLTEMGGVTNEQARNFWAELFGASPVVITSVSLDTEAFHVLGELFCSLHRLAPLRGGQLVFQEVPHPLAMEEVSRRLGWSPEVVTDMAAANRQFLRRTFGYIDQRRELLGELEKQNLISAEEGEKMQKLLGILSDPLSAILKKFTRVSDADIFEGWRRISRLPEYEGPSVAPESMAPGLMRPGFERRTGSVILEARDGWVTFGLSRPLAPADFSQICTRLNRCAVRFLLHPPLS